MSDNAISETERELGHCQPCKAWDPYDCYRLRVTPSYEYDDVDEDEDDYCECSCHQDYWEKRARLISEEEEWED